MSNSLLNYQQLSEQKVPVKVQTLRKWVMENKIPHLKISSRVFFDPIEIDEWLQSKRVAARGKK